MEPSVILIKISELLNQHENCGDTKHILVVMDGELRLIHDGRMLTAPCVIGVISREQINQGLTITEWTRISRKVERLLGKTKA